LDIKQKSELVLPLTVTIFFIFLTDYHLLMTDWKGYLIAGFSLVWVANIYMSLFGLVRQDIKWKKTEIKSLEQRRDDPKNT